MWPCPGKRIKGLRASRHSPKLAQMNPCQGGQIGSAVGRPLLKFAQTLLRRVSSQLSSPTPNSPTEEKKLCSRHWFAAPSPFPPELSPTTRLCLDSPQQPLIMTAVLSDLGDDQIEQLLSAAEHSLANKAPASAVAVKSKQQGLVTTTTAPVASVSTGDGKPAKDAVKQAEELSLRVPQLKSKQKKVRALPVLP